MILGKQLTEKVHQSVVKIRVRVRSEDSAFVYFVMEAHEGVMSYRTLDHQEGVAYRDLEVLIPASQEAEGIQVLERIPEVLWHLPC